MPPKNALFLLAALVVMAFGVKLRVAHLHDPMRNDESFTYLTYVKRADYFDYSRPNNHVLNTLLMAAVSSTLGDTPAELRLPAFTFGILLLPAVGLLCFQLCASRTAALVAMALASSSVALVEYSVNARGYSLVALAAVLLASLTIRLKAAPDWKAGWALWAACCIAGLYAIPVMLYAIAPPLLLLIADSWPENRKRLLPLTLSLAGTGLITALLYSPVIAKSGLSAITANPFVTAMAPGSLPAELATRFKETAAIWSASASPILLPFLCAGTLFCLGAFAMRRGDRFLLLALTGILLAIAAAVLQRRVAPVRAYLYLRPG